MGHIVDPSFKIICTIIVEHVDNYTWEFSPEISIAQCCLNAGGTFGRKTPEMLSGECCCCQSLWRQRQLARQFHQAWLDEQRCTKELWPEDLSWLSFWSSSPSWWCSFPKLLAFSISSLAGDMGLLKELAGNTVFVYPTLFPYLPLSISVQSHCEGWVLCFLSCRLGVKHQSFPTSSQPERIVGFIWNVKKSGNHLHKNYWPLTTRKISTRLYSIANTK